jgi:hypothetical protein
MAARGIHLVRGAQPRLRHIIFELRYRYGYTYLDRCGRVLNRLTRDHPEWVVGNDVSPQNAPLYSVVNGCRFSFSSIKLDLALEKSADEDEIEEQNILEFANQVDIDTSIVTDELGLESFTRIGFRSLFFFPFDTKEKADEWLFGLGFFEVSKNLVNAFGGTRHSVGLAGVFSGPDARYRVSLSTIEIPAQFDGGSEIVSIKPSALPTDQRQHLLKHLKERRRMRLEAGCAAVIDIDSYQDDPPSIDPRDFIARNAGSFMDKIRASSMSHQS